MSRCLPVLVAAGLLLVGTSRADEPPSDLNSLSMEVAALQTLDQLAPSSAQLKLLEALAKTTGDRRKRKAVKAAPALPKLLLEMREALLRGNENRIDEVGEKLAAAAESVKLDDEVILTEASRKPARLLLARLSPRQAAGMIAALGEEWKGPATRIRDALRAGRKLSAAEWKALRDEAADDVAWLVAGASPTAGEVRDKASALLDKARKADKSFDLTKAVAGLVGRVGPVRMLQNALERELAELLSNPRLGHAARALLAGRKK
jgi:hypothetical protein